MSREGSTYCLQILKVENSNFSNQQNNQLAHTHINKTRAMIPSDSQLSSVEVQLTGLILVLFSCGESSSLGIPKDR